MNSVISEMPGPDVLVKAREPFQPAPITMPIEASSSSAWTMAYLALPVSLSCRSRLQWRLEGLGERRGRRDGIPGAHRGAAIDRAQRGGVVAFDEDAVADVVGAADLELHARRDRHAALTQSRPRLQRLDVGIEQLLLALELLAEQPLDLLGVDVEQHRQRADIDDVLEQLALAGVGVGGVGDGR